MAERKKRTPSWDPEKPQNKRLGGRTAVYRLLDKDGRLLYAGVSHNPVSRWKAHEINKYWWHWVADKQVVWCPTRLAAFQLEAEIEYAENPRFCRVEYMGNGSLSREPKRDEDDEDLKRELVNLTAELCKQMEAGVYPLRGELPLAESHAARYGTSRSLFSLAFYRAQREVGARGEAQ